MIAPRRSCPADLRPGDTVPPPGDTVAPPGDTVAPPGDTVARPGDTVPRTGDAIEIEVIAGDPALLRPPAEAALAAAGVGEGHAAITLVSEAEIRRLNRDHRGIDRPTDVLSFPVDAVGPAPGPRELGDVVICPEHTEHLAEAVVHGMLHLCGHDHERDAGEMLALQDRVMAGLR